MATAYLKHDGNARNDEKIIRLRMKHKAAGYGVYFMILERLMADSNYMSVRDYNIIAYDLREDSALIKSVIEDFGLFEFTEDNKFFYSKRLQENMIDLDNQFQNKSRAGKIGMAKRWQKESVENEGVNNSVITELKQSNNDVITINKINKINKITPSSVSPIQATQPSCGSDKVLVEDYSFYQARYAEALRNVTLLTGRKDSSPEEIIPIMRFLTDKANVEIVRATIKAFPKNRHLYELRQALEAMEKKGDLKPMAVMDWRTVGYINDNLNLADRKRINDVLKLNKEGTWEILVDAVMAVRKDKESGKNKIAMPGRYIIATITKI